MIRATGTAHARMTDRLLLGNKLASEACSCDESKALREQIEAALMLLRGGFVERAARALEAGG